MCLMNNEPPKSNLSWVGLFYAALCLLNLIPILIADIFLLLCPIFPLFLVPCARFYVIRDGNPG